MEDRRFKKQILPKTSGQRLNPIGIVLHETATPGATAQAEYKYFCKETGRSAHAFIDWAEDLQIVPWDVKAWHAKEPANTMFIGVEMCRPKTYDPDKIRIVYWATVDAFARLYRWVLEIRVVTKENLMSHHEVSLKWNNTTHTDPTGLFKEYGYSVDQFRLDVQHRLDVKWEAK